MLGQMIICFIIALYLWATDPPWLRRLWECGIVPTIAFCSDRIRDSIAPVLTIIAAPLVWIASRIYRGQT